MRLAYLFAYLDPNTGSMAYQIAISGFLAGVAMCKMYWAKIKKLFSKKDSKRSGP